LPEENISLKEHNERMAKLQKQKVGDLVNSNFGKVGVGEPVNKQPAKNKMDEAKISKKAAALSLLPWLSKLKISGIALIILGVLSFVGGSIIPQMPLFTTLGGIALGGYMFVTVKNYNEYLQKTYLS